jgi:RimJ/RimL family protein N-acetyltransferase
MSFVGQSKLELLPFPPEDWPIIWKWLRKSKLSLTHDDGPHTEREFVDSHIERESLNLGVYSSGKLVGLFICDHVSSVVCEAHCYFKPSFWGWKNTVRALHLGIDVAFNERGYQKITSPVLESNRLMIRLLEHIGAVREGRFIAHARQNGKPVNVCFYSIFRGD